MNCADGEQLLNAADSIASVVDNASGLVHGNGSCGNGADTAAAIGRLDEVDRVGTLVSP